ncbi:MAG: HlyD family efflux transporter periplasmic adaptor subunit [Planctomycetaceae bacterium]|nr:HlyD family efflux transporter periplasmic adaptor subunit [Planctomycetaceae bacterium]
MAPNQTLPSIPGRQLPPPNALTENQGPVSGQDTVITPNAGTMVQPVSNSQSPGNPLAKIEMTSEGRIRVSKGMVIVIEKIQLPARESGVLGQLNAKEGQLIEGGALIAKVDDSQAITELESSKRRLEASELKVSSDIGIRYATAARETAWKTFKREDVLFRRGAGIESKRDELQLAAVQADLQLEKANHDFQVDQKAVRLEQIQVTKAEQLVERHDIIAPWSGVVTKTLKRQSEWVNAGDPILELVQMDRIWIEASLNPAVVHPYQVTGKAAIVTLSLPGGEKVAFDGRITFVDSQVVGDSYKVRAEVLNRQHENYWLLVPGMFVDMELLLQDSSVDRVSRQ